MSRQTYLSLFPAFPRSPRAFVAMSFAEEFKPRFDFRQAGSQVDLAIKKIKEQRFASLD